jgi:hypothetical protein
MPGNCPGKNAPFDIPAFPNKVGRSVVMSDTLHILLYDWPFIEIGRHVVGCRANELDAPRECLVVWFGAFEPRKERVVNIDAAA